MKLEDFRAWLRGEPVEGALSQADLAEGRALQPIGFTINQKGDDALITNGIFAGRLVSDLDETELVYLAFDDANEYDAGLREFAKWFVEERRGT